MPVHLFEDSVGLPSAALHDVGIGDSDCVLDGSAVMSQIMESEMGKSGSFYKIDKPVGYLARLQVDYPAASFLDS